ncbi:MAG: aldolase/citrate lyase family protein [Clostridium sp.]|nr:aldolase/citrate lyase family protein [Clostridium sp.]
MTLKLMYVTNSPMVAQIAQKYGVDRIWIDLETIGKQERQGHINSVKSNHSISDIKNIKPILSSSEVLVRINPLYENSKKEIDEVINAGADLIMLPMWRTVSEVKKFLNMVNGRVKTVLLLETKEAVECLDEILNLGGFDEIHIGLNDLHLSYHLTFMFELLKNGIVEGICEKIKKKNIPYGFGGIAGIGQGVLHAEKIIAEHYRLGSTRAILSRSFCNTELIKDKEQINSIFRDRLYELREYEKFVEKQDSQFYLKNKEEIYIDVNKIVENIKMRE